MRLCLIFIFSSAFLFAKAQGELSPQGELRDAYGQPVSTKNTYGVEGSPYLMDTYKPGRLIINGTSYPNLKIKLNLEKSTVFFEKNGAEMVAVGKVNVVEFIDETSGQSKVFKSGFPAINKNTTHTYYQVLDSGKATLLKHIGVQISESRQYGEAATIKRYEQIKNYYLLVNGNFVHLKKNDAIFEVLNEKKKELEKFIANNKIKANREDDLKTLVSFYNKL